FRFALVGLGAKSGDGKPVRVELSGDRAKAGIWVSALREGAGAATAGMLLFTPASEGAATGSLLLVASGEPAPAFLALRQGGGPLTPIEAVALADGDRLQVAGRSWTFTTATGLFGPPARLTDEAGHTVDVPRRASELPLLGIGVPLGRPLPPSQETYPLAWLEKAATGSLPSPRPEAFLFRRGGAFFLAAPGGQANLGRAGIETVFVPIPRKAPLGPGDALHVVSFPHWDENGFAAGGWRDRRSFRADLGRRSLALAFDTPEVHSLPWKGVKAERKKVALEDLALVLPTDRMGRTDPSDRSDPTDRSEVRTRQDRPLRVSLSFGDWEFADRSLHFASAGRRVAGEALATLELPRDPAAAAAEGRCSAAPPRGQRRARFGQPFWLGEENAAAVQVDLVALPFLLGLFALALAPLKAWAAREAGFTQAHLAAAAALEGLLAVRVLLGFRAWALAPHSEEAMRLALIAWGLLPWALIAAAWPRIPRHSYDEDAPTGRGLLLSPVAGGLFFAAAWAWAMSGGGIKGLVWWAVALALLALPVLSGEGRLARRSPLWAVLGR
ncbi:MAG TPA: hypothetical protein VFX28_01990, partial [Methylomirabilota bacterium]|nr:hypothetical protein [Methylomirabilota bacterium]